MRWVIVLAVIAGCSRKAPPAPPKPDAAVAAQPKHAKRGGTNVTFCVVSDTHFGYGGMEEQNARLVSRVNTIEGKSYPTSLGGTVARPRGLLVTGDLTEWGREEEWRPFAKTYGLDGGDGDLRVPVFEVVGNHDKVHGPWVTDTVAARHGGRWYSWDWDDLHLVALGEAPDDDGLAFLARDLDRLEKDVPVVLFFHLPLAGPWSTGHWFAEGPYRDRLFEILRGHAIAGIFHGHHHATGHYVWRNIDVWKPGAVKNDAHTFAVVHVTDARITVASYDWERDAFRDETFSRPFVIVPSAPD
jgi:cytolysin (calcineurin-like family phosphatase)